MRTGVVEATEGTQVLDKEKEKALEIVGESKKKTPEDTGDHRRFVEKTLEIIGDHRKIE